MTLLIGSLKEYNTHLKPTPYCARSSAHCFGHIAVPYESA